MYIAISTHRLEVEGVLAHLELERALDEGDRLGDLAPRGLDLAEARHRVGSQRRVGANGAAEDGKRVGHVLRRRPELA